MKKIVKRIVKSIVRKFGYNNQNAIYLIYKTVNLNEKNIINRIRRNILSNRLERKYHIIVGRYCKIGKNLSLPHPQNIVIGGYVNIGDNCKIFQDVTIGLKVTNADIRPENYPKVGENCVICVGAKILGGIKIHDNSIIAANAVVTKDVEANSLYAGIPAELKKRYG